MNSNQGLGSESNCPKKDQFRQVYSFEKMFVQIVFLAENACSTTVFDTMLARRNTPIAFIQSHLLHAILSLLNQLNSLRLCANEPLNISQLIYPCESIHFSTSPSLSSQPSIDILASFIFSVNNFYWNCKIAKANKLLSFIVKVFHTQRIF